MLIQLFLGGIIRSENILIKKKISGRKNKIGKCRALNLQLLWECMYWFQFSDTGYEYDNKDWIETIFLNYDNFFWASSLITYFTGYKNYFPTISPWKVRVFSKRVLCCTRSVTLSISKKKTASSTRGKITSEKIK